MSREYVASVVLLAAAYFGAAKLGQTLRYTASVSAIWPPVGVGIAALYLWGLRLWPGIFIAELFVNGQLFLGENPLPLGSLAGQQLGNMAEVVLGAYLLGRLAGPRVRFDRATQVASMFLAAGSATAVSATVGTLSMLAGGVIGLSSVLDFWRTWWLGDTAGALVVVPLALTWLGDAKAALRRMWAPEAVLMIGTVAALVTVAVSSNSSLTYLVFPALIWAAFRFATPGVTLANLIVAALTIGLTADDVGAFSSQPIDQRTLSTQLYIVISALTALFLSAVVAERERSAGELAEARLREGERALEERRRIARDLHDSVSQTLFSSVLQIRAAQNTLAGNAGGDRGLRDRLVAVAELTKRAQREMRGFIFEWGTDGVGDGLVSAFTLHVRTLGANSGLAVDVRGPEGPLPLTLATQAQLYSIGREALANVERHSDARTATLRIEARAGHVTMEIADDGRGFDVRQVPQGHYGLESMRSRASEIHSDLKLWSRPGMGTLIRVDVPFETAPLRDAG